jgi:Sulfatase-modifying factor enzyme 1
MLWILGGTFHMGSSDHYSEEAPVHRVSIDGFWIDRAPVTNKQFKAFVKATGHVTTALAGYDAGGKTFKVHLDGYNQLPHLTDRQDRGARKEFIYFNDDGDLVALRYENRKFVFEEQRVPGTLQVWAEPFTKLRLPKLFDLRADPYERADITSNTYYDWLLSQGYVIVAAQAVIGQFLASFKDFPPSQRAQSFSIDQIVEKMQRSLEATQSN